MAPDKACGAAVNLLNCAGIRRRSAPALAFVPLDMFNPLFAPPFLNKRKMQTIPNIDYFLNDADREIQVQHDSVIDGAFNMKRKFSSLLTQTRQLKTMMLAKQAELDRYIAQYGPHRPDLKASPKVFGKSSDSKPTYCDSVGTRTGCYASGIKNWAMIWKLRTRNWKRSITCGAASVLWRSRMPWFRAVTLPAGNA
ncbi:uncharacterized protein PV06_11092 [Exophiala oligosperma]|uniref:Uncharacterized protein n=1 Tax=Exophiala oligosperma TaxID=215243 RepID=A0A0D2DLS6_9EURO|nr:uncharacterized protein PV06_11092 [Exophiala oligosperma]KIW36674.1 hypothetical protein PV06_11092 [Exophiala oligosperma]